GNIECATLQSIQRVTQRSEMTARIITELLMLGTHLPDQLAHILARRHIIGLRLSPRGGNLLTQALARRRIIGLLLSPRGGNLLTQALARRRIVFLGLSARLFNTGLRLSPRLFDTGLRLSNLLTQILP